MLPQSGEIPALYVSLGLPNRSGKYTVVIHKKDLPLPCNCCRFVSARKFSAVWTSSSNCGFFCSSSRKTFCKHKSKWRGHYYEVNNPCHIIKYTATNAKWWFPPRATVTQRIVYNRCDVQTVANCNLMTRSRTARHILCPKVQCIDWKRV